MYSKGQSNKKYNFSRERERERETRISPGDHYRSPFLEKKKNIHHVNHNV